MPQDGRTTADDPELNSRVSLLVEEAIVSERTPEEVCAECPELTSLVRRQWEHCRVVQDELEAIFPSSTTTRSGGRRPALARCTEIPGYADLEFVGKGGFGAVYRARHVALNRWVAIKMLLAGPTASVLERARFRREAEALARLRHENVVAVHDVGEIGDVPFFTMEYVDGGTLGQKLAGEPQPARAAATMVESIARAVEAAHGCGILHRDLKPSDVLLTASGVPKVSDFGMARQNWRSDEVSIAAALAGTPSYMSPEQASATAGEVGPASDVYSLGAILYEMLTGRPPFRGESPAETQRQLLHEDAVPPSRLNSRVPRDLETICAKCLSKDPPRRYSSAAALAADLRRFLTGEPIEARRAGRTERAVKWARRHPARAVAMASFSLFVGAVLVGASWLSSQRSARAAAIREDLAVVIAAQARSHWKEAGEAMSRVSLRLAQGAPADLHARYEDARRDLRTVEKLERIHLRSTDSTDGVVALAGAADEYDRAMGEAGFGRRGDPPGEVAARVRASPIRAAIVSAMDDWTLCPQSPAQHRWIMDVARRADADPTGWRNRLRDPAIWEDGAALAPAADAADMREQPSFLLAIAVQLQERGRDALPFLKKLQSAHPDDPWVNAVAAQAFYSAGNSSEAIRCAAAAVACRPDSAFAHQVLSVMLKAAKRHVDALEELRIAVRLDPTSPLGQWSFAWQLMLCGNFAEAEPELRRAVAMSPRWATACRSLGTCLVELGRDDEGLEWHRRAVEYTPSDMSARSDLRTHLIRRGMWEEAWKTWEADARYAPAGERDASGYAEFCLFAGHEDEYRSASLAVLESLNAKADAEACERAGRCSLLSPSSSDELRRAVAAIDRAAAMRGKPGVSNVLGARVAKALACYRQGDFRAALAIAERDASRTPVPMRGLIAAMCHSQLGERDLAQRALAGAAASFDWSAGHATDREAWVCHVLRREAEAMITPGTAVETIPHLPQPKL